MKNIDLNNYTIHSLRNCSNDEIMTMIALNNKHTVRDFQNEINRVKNEFENEIMQYGDDWSIIQENISKDFDWFEISIDTENDLEF